MQHAGRYCTLHLLYMQAGDLAKHVNRYKQGMTENRLFNMRCYFDSVLYTRVPTCVVPGTVTLYYYR